MRGAWIPGSRVNPPHVASLGRAAKFGAAAAYRADDSTSPKSFLLFTSVFYFIFPAACDRKSCAAVRRRGGSPFEREIFYCWVRELFGY